MSATMTERQHLRSESNRRRAAKAERHAALLKWLAKNPGEPVSRGAEAVGMTRWEACDVVRKARTNHG